MTKQGLNLERHYHPDEEVMLKSLMLLLRSKDPPEERLQENEETISSKLAGHTLMVSQPTEEQDKGDPYA